MPRATLSVFFGLKTTVRWLIMLPGPFRCGDAVMIDMVLQDPYDERLKGKTRINRGVLQAPVQVFVQIERKDFFHGACKVTGLSEVSQVMKATIDTEAALYQAWAEAYENMFEASK